MDKLLIKRQLITHVRNAAKYYPIVSVAGPRQAGKSTMLKQAFPDYQYVSMEDPDIYALATTDARGFFDRYSEGVIIDEAQKVPNLFSYMQSIVDKKRTPGRFVLSGSQNYLLHRNITQSLAGRIDLSTLYPLDFDEMGQIDSWDDHLEKVIINGFYPGKLVEGIPGKMFYSNYIKTYLERDVSDLVNVGNMTTFRTFLKLVAYKCGSQLKMTDLSNDLNVSVNTIKTWITILESSYIIFMLPSYHKNLGKRLLKTPKLYFFDTGLLCHLLGLNDEEKLRSSDKFGIVFENLVIAEKVKYKAHRHLDPDMFFFRDSNGLEVDLFEINGIDKVAMTELKSGKTFKSEFLVNMKKLKDIDPSLSMNLVYNGEDNVKLTELEVKNWRSLHV
ncbi:MAG: ATP-binding protein [Saprospiraceae bacterium]|nr:ATP-binding protein [Saprospiraceae bacterium]